MSPVLVPAGLRSLAVAMPGACRTNDYWRRKYPAMVADAETRTLAGLWNAKGGSAGSEDFDAEMQPFLADPFRGTRERRLLAPGETSITLGVSAGRDAIRAAGLRPTDIDLIISCAFLPNTLGVGDATFLARELGLRGGAFNLETACSSGLLALQTASALVASRQYRHVLVVVSCTYSRTLDDTDTLSWFLGDGAGAFVVSEVPVGEGIQGAHTMHTADTCGAASYAIDAERDVPRLAFRVGKETGRTLRDKSREQLLSCCHGALERAAVRLDDIRFFVVNTPTAWFEKFVTRALAIDPERTLSCFPSYGNMGPALLPVNLWHAAAEKRIKPGDLVMLYTVGSVSSAAAMVLRWGDVRLGPAPLPARLVDRGSNED